MSRIAEALTRAVAPGHTTDGRIDFAIERPAAGLPQGSELGLYAPESAPHVSMAPATKPEPVAPSSSPRQEPVEHPAEWNHKLVGAHEMPEVAIEQYRRLAGTLQNLQLQRGLKTLMVSSAVPREGKTLTVTNLALTLSHSYRRKVLLIDADLRHPSVHEVLGLRNADGLADVVRSEGRRAPIIRLSEHLSVLTAGRPDRNPLAQLSSKYVEEFLRAIAQQFDWVLVDTPPIGLISDAQMVARLCEAALFVVAAGSTPYSLVQRGLSELGDDRVVGVVLNRMQRKDLPHDEQYGHYYMTGRGAGA